jgi:small subunit ribosomal protein S2
VSRLKPGWTPAAVEPEKDSRMSVSELPAFNVRQLLEAGVHFGHQSHRWNPKMSPYIYGERNNIHIIDLRETAPLRHRGLLSSRDSVSCVGSVLFLGSSREVSEMLAFSA